MCGIVGAFGPSAQSLSSNIEKALSELRHRGPDAKNQVHDQGTNLVLGHTRLKILDLSDRANQPMNYRGNLLAYNGEVYNHQILREDLGHDFETSCDTETLLLGLSKKGASDFLPELNGMFAGAFYDHSDHELTLFRDDLGIKPLYLASMPDGTRVFASEVKSLFALAPVLPRRVNRDVLACYLEFENYPQGHSLFEGIQLLKPGEMVRLFQGDSGVVARSEIYQTRVGKDWGAPEGDLVSQIQARFEQSVQSHMLSDVPVAVYMSGGLDSSSVATVAARDKSVTGFTGYFEVGDSYYDERDLAKEVANQAGINLVEVPIRPEDFENVFDSLVYSLDEPRMGMGSFSQSVVARRVANDFKVILAGHGGDELFGGYPMFKAFRAIESSGGPYGFLKNALDFNKREIPWLVDALAGKWRTGAFRFAPRIYRQKGKLTAGDTTRAPFFTSGEQPMAALQEYYLEVYLPGLLVVEDKVSMAHSLETRLPLWTQGWIDWVNRIPIDQKLRDGQLKSLFKEAAKAWLPDRVLQGPKRGFPTPLRHWFRKELRSTVQSRLLDRPTPLDEIFGRIRIEKTIRSHLNRPLPFALDERRAHQVWMLLSLESWFRQFEVQL